MPGTSKERQLRLERPSRQPPLLLSVVPIRRLGLALPGTPMSDVAVFIVEPDAPRAIDRLALVDAFGLTPRESEVAVLLAQGFDLITIGAQLQLGLAIVRFHLKNVLDKTGTHSQAALVALLRGFVNP